MAASFGGSHMSKTEVRRLVIGFAVVVAFVMVIAIVSAVVTNGQERESTREQARALDIVSYDPPAWGKERISDCWEVEDRLNNRKFWLIKVDGQWVPLDIGEVENLG